MPYYKHRKRPRKKIVHKSKYKSGLEEKFAQLAEKQKLKFTYEPAKFPYVVQSHYLPDFEIAKNRFVETKGFFSASNRQRMLMFKEQYPNVEILFLFGNADNKLNARSKTTYREWAEKHGFRCSDIRDPLPKAWWRK